MTLPKRFVTSDRGRNNVQINTRGLHRKCLPFSDWERLYASTRPTDISPRRGYTGLRGARRMTAPGTSRRRRISLDGHVARRLTRNLMQGSRSYHGDGAGTSSLHWYHGAGEQGKSLLLGNGWSRRISPIPTVKAGKRLNMCSGYCKASREWARRLGQKGMKH